MEFRIPNTPANPGTPAPAAEKVRQLRPGPSDEALRLLNWLVNRSRRTTGLPLAEPFVRRAEASAPAPPLARLLRGGQGGEVRLKLYLTMSLLAVNPPYDIAQPVPARSWAEMLDLPDPGRNGARRVNDAIDWLADNKLIVSERRQGTPGAVRLLSQDGSGEPYTRPRGSERYVRLPLGLWQDGWVVRLSGAALALLIILMDMQGARARASWVSPAQARARYDLSPDTWTKGVQELEAFELVNVVKKPQGDFFDYKRMRNSYWVSVEKIQGAAPPGAGPGGGRAGRRVRVSLRVPSAASK